MPINWPQAAVPDSSVVAEQVKVTVLNPHRKLTGIPLRPTPSMRICTNAVTSVFWSGVALLTQAKLVITGTAGGWEKAFAGDEISTADNARNTARNFRGSFNLN